jgi:hypothetical protein
MQEVTTVWTPPAGEGTEGSFSLGSLLVFELRHQLTIPRREILILFRALFHADLLSQRVSFAHW